MSKKMIMVLMVFSVCFVFVQNSLYGQDRRDWWNPSRVMERQIEKERLEALNRSGRRESNNSSSS